MTTQKSDENDWGRIAEELRTFAFSKAAQYTVTFFYTCLRRGVGSALKANDVHSPLDHLATSIMASGYYSRDTISRMVMPNPSIYAALSDSTQHPELMAAESRIPAMPTYWEFKFHRCPPLLSGILRVGFIMLCVLSFGHHDLKEIWIFAYQDKQEWRSFRERLAGRNSTLLIMVSCFPPPFQPE